MGSDRPAPPMVRHAQAMARVQVMPTGMACSVTRVEPQRHLPVRQQGRGSFRLSPELRAATAEAEASVKVARWADIWVLIGTLKTGVGFEFCQNAIATQS